MQSNVPFFLVALVTVTAAAAAMRLRNLVHCALCAALAFGGLAVAYMLLDAEFVALAQFLIYVGAVAVLIVFGIMLTRGAENCGDAAIAIPRSWIGLTIAALLGAILIWAALGVPSTNSIAPLNGAASVRQIGIEMMSHYVVPLEAVGLLLTAALVGAAVIAMREEAPPKGQPERAEPALAIPPPPPPLELTPVDHQ